MRRDSKPYVIAPSGRQIVGNLIKTKDGTVWAGYRIGSSRWDFTGQESKTAAILREADIFSNLTGRGYHQRISTRPHPVQAWAAQLDARTPHPAPDIHTCDQSMSRGDLLRGRCGCETWSGHLVRMQHRIAATGMDDKVIFRYFTLVKVSAGTDLRKHWNEYLRTGVVHSSIRDVVADEKKVMDVVSGWRGTVRMTEHEQAWLRKRSMAPGMPVGLIATRERGGWDDFSIGSLATDIQWSEQPFGRTLGVDAWLDGKQHHTAVRMMSVARMSDLHYPENGLPPWMTYAEQVRDASGAPFSVEWSVVGRLLAGEHLEKQVERDLRKALFVERDYRNHKEIPPATVAQSIQVAKDTRDQVTTGQSMEAARFLGQVNVIVSGSDRYEDGRVVLSAQEVVEERCAKLAHLYSGSNLRMDFVGVDCQSYSIQSSIPGEPYDKVGYQRRLRLPYLAAGMPTVTTTIGDGRGPYLGFTRGSSRRPVQHDPHFATEGQHTGRSQNMHVALSTLGGGRSVLFGTIIYNLVRRGIRSIVSDPSGPLARLCTMPELKEVSQEVNLLQGRRGVLNPAALVREPVITEFDEPGAYADARIRAAAERRDLIVEMALRSCPADLYEDPRTREALREAARRHHESRSWEITSTMWDLMDNLEGPFGQAVYGALMDASTAPLLSLMFPDRDGPAINFATYDKTLTVITTPGITRAPNGVPRADWTPQEVGADAILRLVALFTDRLVYTKERNTRCAVFFDEAESLTDSHAGQAALSRLGRDHSKWNTAVYLSLKTINDRMFSGELKNFIASIFVGRMAGIEPAQAALGLLGLSDPGYLRVLTGLSTHRAGEFVHMDVNGDIGDLVVDVDYFPRLKEHLMTDPTPEGSSNWILDEEML